MHAPNPPTRMFLSAALVILAAISQRIGAQAPPAPGTTPTPSANSTPNQTQPAPPPTNATADSDLPGVIYKEAMHPLDIVRQSLDNWSDTELAALHLGMKMAYDACEKMNPEDYTKDDLYDLAHLCAFGQDWNAANTAAVRYIALKAPEHRTQAYAISVGAFVHLNAIDLALATTEEMLAGQPYDAEVAYTLRYMKDALETAADPKALDLAEQEHPKIVDALSKAVPLKATYGDAVVSVGLLDEMAMEAAFFERYAGNDTKAAALMADIEQALPQNAPLTAEDRQQIDSVKLRYHLLGTKIEPLPVLRSYKSATAKPKIDTNFGAATVFVVFPDWCVQCRKMMPEMTQFAAADAATPISTYGLVFTQDGETNPPDLQKELLGTNALEISEDTARAFGANDYPLGIVVDHSGIIHFIGVLPADAFTSTGYIGKVLMHIPGASLNSPAESPHLK